MNRAVHSRWRGGSQLHSYSKKNKNSKPNSRLSEKKGKKRIPLGDYQWPESNENIDRAVRPVTAINPNIRGDMRPATNYEAKRRNIQSRGKANPTGLSGTSQSSGPKEGKVLN